MTRQRNHNREMKGVLNLEYALDRERRRDYSYRIKRRLFEVLKAINKYYPQPKKILDLGTAEGRMLHSIKKEYGDAECIGVEYSMNLAIYGLKKYPEIHFIRADIQNLSFLKGETFDVIIATAVIEHLASPPDMIKESYRLLKKNGIIIITSPHPFWEKISNILGLLNSEHQIVMNDKKILNLFYAENFSIVEHKGFMVSPSGIKGELKIEKLLTKLHADKYMLNRLFVAKKLA